MWGKNKRNKKLLEEQRICDKLTSFDIRISKLEKELRDVIMETTDKETRSYSPKAGMEYVSIRKAVEMILNFLKVRKHLVPEVPPREELVKKGK